MSEQPLDGIAIIGMAGRFPKAPDLEQFWRNLRDGIDSVSFFSDAELEASGVSPENLRNPNYIKAKAVLEDAGMFDAAFFDIAPREAELTDPQIRVFLECSWQALESAGYDADTYTGLIGVYAGMSFSSYMLQVLGSNAGPERINTFRALLGSDKDYLSTWVSYKLNLHGPSLNVQTACSTSLAAVHLACRALTTFECDMALAGGVSITAPQCTGYLYEQGSIFSSDGHCRTFDASSTGSMAGEGAGVVLLKRLEDAVNDGDTIHAVIKGSAINNDGRRKVGYTAPAVDGQAEVISMALAVAEVDRPSIGYIEAHGSGTKVGDPIEITALNQVYGKTNPERGSMPVGSVKTNIGHLGPASGIAGLLKTVLAMQHGQIPASLHFQIANPEIPFERGPFRVNSALSDWPQSNQPRRAGVSSFGVGGTNVHVVLEEAPRVASLDAGDAGKPWELIAVSARTPAALENATDQLAEHLCNNSGQNFADVAFTLQIGRKPFEHRRMLVCRDEHEAAKLLAQRVPTQVFTREAPAHRRPVAFLFPGLGDHYVDMGRGLYESEPEFKKHVDFCCEFLRPLLGIDLREAIYPKQAVRNQAEAGSRGFDFRKMVTGQNDDSGMQEPALYRTIAAQPALFVLEFALAKLWMSWGIVPESMLGYSIGEYVVACIAGVISLEDSLRLVAERARRIEALPAGAMLAIAAGQEQIAKLLPSEISIAGVNSSSLCVVAGPVEAIESLERKLVEEKEFVCRRLQTAHAFHSPMMEPAAAAVSKLARTMKLSSPRIPYVSNVTGTWITDAEARDPEYWIRHLCQPVQFAQGLREICSRSQPVLLEAGPGQMLSSIAEQYLAGTYAMDRVVLPSLPHSSNRRADRAFILETLGQLWLAGIHPDWSAFHAQEKRRRVSLPTYPFQRRLYWLERRVQWMERPQAASSDDGVTNGGHQAAEAMQQVAEPTNGSGKHSRPDLGTPYAEPTNSVEQKVVEIWENLLGIHPVGIHDNFLRLGGNSLLAIRVAAELREAFQIDLSVQAMMTTFTAAELAVVVEETLVTMIEGMDETEVS